MRKDEGEDRRMEKYIRVDGSSADGGGVAIV